MKGRALFSTSALVLSTAPASASHGRAGSATCASGCVHSSSESGQLKGASEEVQSQARHHCFMQIYGPRQDSLGEDGMACASWHDPEMDPESEERRHGKFPKR